MKILLFIHFKIIFMIYLHRSMQIQFYHGHEQCVGNIAGKAQSPFY